MAKSGKWKSPKVRSIELPKTKIRPNMGHKEGIKQSRLSPNIEDRRKTRFVARVRSRSRPPR